MCIRDSAYIFDENMTVEKYINRDSVVVRPYDPQQDDACKALIVRHVAETRSAKAKAILDDWDNASRSILVVEPVEAVARRSSEGSIGSVAANVAANSA